MKGQHAAPVEQEGWKAVALAVADWSVGMGIQVAYLVIALLVVAPMAVRRRLSGPRPAHAAPHR
jgi:hypothetical protein